MPTLNWIDKDAVVKHHLEVPFHLLKGVPELSCCEPGTGNIIAQGDNLIALKALLPHFAGQVKFSAGRHLGEDRNICPDTPRDLR
jgi:site-specific DNA-methyltransferase (adenine-specific)/adenine-specific DNA-methyltransferase